MVALLLVLARRPGRPHLRGAAALAARDPGEPDGLLGQPGTRLGFWMHFTTQFSATTLSLLWGYPFFVRGEGRRPRRPGCCSP